MEEIGKIKNLIFFLFQTKDPTKLCTLANFALIDQCAKELQQFL